ncbi:hypothetical protein HD554DRAFT_2180552 [Boletus coccyginus]|nr:hypothetical protein HD554DRAFT_2180552 [Boletus coccyginus]
MNNEPISYHQELLPLNIIQNVNHMVTVYTWTTENLQPVLCQFQQDTFPYFTFTDLVLHHLHLLDAEVQYYSHVHGGWVGINIDHSIKLSDGDGTILFVKAVHVEHCPAFKQHLQKCFPHLDFLANLNNLHHSPRGHRPPPLEHHSPTGHDDSDHPFQHAIHVFSDGEQVPLAPDLGDEEHNVRVHVAKEKQCTQTHSISDNSSAGDIISQSAVIVPCKHKHLRYHCHHSSPTPSKSITGASAMPPIIIPYQPCHCSSPSNSSDSADMSSYSSWEGLDPARTLIDDTTAGNLLMHGDSQENAIDVEEVRLWPADFYVYEIAEGFEHCTVAVAAYKGIGKVFQQYFGLAKFIPSTYYDN